MESSRLLLCIYNICGIDQFCSSNFTSTHLMKHTYFKLTTSKENINNKKLVIPELKSQRIKTSYREIWRNHDIVFAFCFPIGTGVRRQSYRDASTFRSVWKWISGNRNFELIYVTTMAHVPKRYSVPSLYLITTNITCIQIHHPNYLSIYQNLINDTYAMMEVLDMIARHHLYRMFFDEEKRLL